MLEYFGQINISFNEVLRTTVDNPDMPLSHDAKTSRRVQHWTNRGEDKEEVKTLGKEGKKDKHRRGDLVCSVHLDLSLPIPFLVGTLSCQIS